MSWYRPSNLFDKVFEGGIILKGVDGLFELLGGLLVLFISPARLNGFIHFVTHRELLEDPHDKVANLLLHATRHYSNGGRIFLAVYLLAHAAIKLIAVIGILRDWLWAYPFSLVSLGLLALYQLYVIFFVKVSAGMILLTVFDAIILTLIWREYRKLQRTNQPKRNGPSRAMFVDAATKHAVHHTLHCLLGCGIGEVLGSAIGAQLGWANAWQTSLAIVLAFCFGYGLTFWGALKMGMNPHAASKTALQTDTVSIVSMEIIDNVLEYIIPGAMNAGVGMWLFWWSEALSLGTAFLVTVPVNRFVMVRFGIGHGGH